MLLISPNDVKEFRRILGHDDGIDERLEARLAASRRARVATVEATRLFMEELKGVGADAGRLAAALERREERIASMAGGRGPAAAAGGP